MKILYPIIDGEITGGNIICLHLIEEALRRNDRVFVNSPTDGPFLRILQSKGVVVSYVDTRRAFRLDRAMALARLIRKMRIDLVHTHGLLGSTILGSLAGWLAGVPVIAHAHVRFAMSPSPIKYAYQALLLRTVPRFCCKQIIAVAKGVADEIIIQGVPASKIVVVYNGIELLGDHNPLGGSGTIREEFQLTNGQPIIGMVGRLCESKGQHLLIQAASQVIKAFPDAVFMIVGEELQSGGEYREQLESMARSLGLTHHLIFTGYRSDVMDLMNTFDLFVLPSSAEGLPVVILEAMAAAKPIVATPVAGVPEIVTHKETGLLVPIEDAQALAEAILWLAQRPQRAQEMGQKGLERVQMNFSLEKMVKDTFQIYKEILN